MPFAVRPIDTPAYYMGLALFLLTLVPVVTRLMAGNLDVFEPIVPISLLIGLAFGIRAMYSSDPTSFSTWLARVSFDDFIGRALMMALAAYCALLVGYYFVAAPVVVCCASNHTFQRKRGPAVRADRRLLALMAIASRGRRWSESGGRNRRDQQGERGHQRNPSSSGFPQHSLSMLRARSRCTSPQAMTGVGSVPSWAGVLPLAALQSLVFGGKTPILLALRSDGGKPLREAQTLGPHLPRVSFSPSLWCFRRSTPSGCPPIAPWRAGSAEPTIDEFASRVAEIPSLCRNGCVRICRFAAESVLGRANGVDALAVIMKYGDAVQLGNPTAYWQIPLYAFVPARTLARQARHSHRHANSPACS